MDADDAHMDADESHMDAGDAHIDAGDVHMDAGDTHMDAGDAHMDAGDAHMDADYKSVTGGPDDHCLALAMEKQAHQCTKCDFTSHQRCGLNKHMLKHSLEQPFACSVEGCKYRSRYPGNLSKHLSIHSDARPWECDKCDSKFKRKVHLRNHMLVHDGRKDYECEECNKLFKTLWELKAHKLSHSDARDYKCDACGHEAKTPSDLRKHYTTHKDTRDIPCPHCDKAYKSRHGLRTHIRNAHTAGTRVACPVCHAVMGNKSALRKHILLHEGHYPLKCELCERRFANRTNMRAHMVVHSEDRPYECQHCPYRGKAEMDVKSHVGAWHPEHLAYKCELCGIAFTKKHYLTQHFNTQKHKLAGSVKQEPGGCEDNESAAGGVMYEQRDPEDDAAGGVMPDVLTSQRTLMRRARWRLGRLRGTHSKHRAIAPFIGLESDKVAETFSDLNTKRCRGRPKGSRKKTKVVVAPNDFNTPARRGRPKGSFTKVRAAKKLVHSTALNGSDLTVKRGRGRPKGSGKKPRLVEPPGGVPLWTVSELGQQIGDFQPQLGTIFLNGPVAIKVEVVEPECWPSLPIKPDLHQARDVSSGYDDATCGWTGFEPSPCHSDGCFMPGVEVVEPECWPSLAIKPDPDQGRDVSSGYDDATCGRTGFEPSPCHSDGCFTPGGGAAEGSPDLHVKLEPPEPCDYTTSWCDHTTSC